MKGILECDKPESCGTCGLSYGYKNRLTKQNERVCVPKSLACEDYTDARAPFCPLRIVEGDGWIKFTDAMPDEGSRFLVADTFGDIYVRTVNQLHRRAETDGVFTPARYGEGTQVTHWMPLPEPPTEDR